MDNPLFLNGEKIFFSPVNGKNMSALFYSLRDMQLNNFYDARQETLRDFIIQMEKKLNSERDIVFVIKNMKGQTLGLIGLFSIDFICRSAEIKFLFVQNQMISSEPIELITFFGFDRVNLNRISIDLAAFNKKIRKLIIRAGYQFEGVLREFINFAGKNHDLAKFSILRDEFNKKLYTRLKERFTLK